MYFYLVNVSKLCLIIAIFLVSASYVNAGVLYEHNFFYNDPIEIGFVGESQTGFTLIDTSATNTNYSNLSYNYTATADIPYFRIKTDESCTSLNPILIDNTGSSPYTVTNSATSTPGYCIYTLSSFNTGDRLYEIYMQGQGGYGTTSFYGSSQNDGATYNNSNEYQGLGGMAFQLCDSGGCTDDFEEVFTQETEQCLINETTRILSFSPADNSTTTSPVFFDFNACIDPEDLGFIQGVEVSLYNIDQNVLLFNQFSPSDIVLLEFDVEDSGEFYFSTTTPIGDGNYRLEACIKRTYLSGWFQNPLSPISNCESHQFIVGSSTFIGNLSQSLFNDTQDFFDGLSATSSEVMASTCNPLNANFGIRECFAYLFIPDSNAISDTVENLREGVFVRFPWGYANRFMTILTSSATTSIPSFTVTLRLGAGSDEVLDTETLTFDPGDMIAGGASLVDSIEDPIYGMTLRDITEPFIQFIFAIAFIWIITKDILAIRHHEPNGESRKTNLS